MVKTKSLPEKVVAIETSMKQAELWYQGEVYGHIGYDRKQDRYIGGLDGLNKRFYHRSIEGVVYEINKHLSKISAERTPQ